MTTLPSDHSVRSDMNCGAIIGRADLSDDVLINAVKERLTSQNRPSDDANAVVNSAMAGDASAIAFLRTVNVPAQTVRLSMPTQPLTREGNRRGNAAPFFRFSWNRG